MNKKIFWVAGLALVMAACNNESEELVPQQVEGKVAMNVQTTVKQSRALVEGTALATGSEIGVTLVEMPEGQNAHGDTYDGLGTDDGYWNILYTAGEQTVEGNQVQTWTSLAPIMLSSTLGHAVAYYPYAAGQSDYKALAVTADGQTDYLYSGWVDADGINNAAPTATFTMKHALSAVKLTFKRGTYTYTGDVTKAVIKSAGFGKSGSLDASTGVITGVTPSVEMETSTDDNTSLNDDFETLTIPTETTNSVNTILMVVPVQNYTVDALTGLAMDITVTIDGKEYSLTAKMTEEFQSGKIYNFDLTLDNTALQVTTVTVTPWGDGEGSTGGTLSPDAN